jgi:hypothetical protein
MQVRVGLRIGLLAVLALVIAGIAIAVAGGSASGKDGWSAQDGRDAIHRAFPAAVDSAVDPAMHAYGAVLAQARINEPGGDTLVIAATNKEALCLSADGTTTCQPGDGVAKYGIFFAAIDCGSKTASLTGLVPNGVRTITAHGQQATVIRATGQGVVSASVRGSLQLLSLDNGAINPRALDLRTICGPRGG